MAGSSSDEADQGEDSAAGLPCGGLEGSQRFFVWSDFVLCALSIPGEFSLFLYFLCLSSLSGLFVARIGYNVNENKALLPLMILNPLLITIEGGYMVVAAADGNLVFLSLLLMSIVGNFTMWLCLCRLHGMITRSKNREDE